jgi:hypothetical protein
MTFDKQRYSERTKGCYRVARCKPQSWLDLISPSTCGPCQYAPIKQRWDDVIADAKKKLSSVDAWNEGELYGRLEVELEGLKEERNAEEWRCRRRFPVLKRADVEKKVETIGDVVTARSPLRRELLPEDIEDMNVGDI